MEKLNQDTSNEDVMNFSFGVIRDSNTKENYKEEILWDKLIQQIIDGNVIPVIGADLLTDFCPNLHEFLIEGFAKELDIDKQPKSFSELIYTDEYKHMVKTSNLDVIYYQVNNFFARNHFPASERLRKLLSIKQFPFVITTSFTPVIEQAMQHIWKDELKVMKFNNNPSENDDIRDSEDLRKPTIYYMFGKVCAGAHRYVLTDLDLLGFVSSWLSNDNKVCPKNLCNGLKDKYLLMLGNTYSDWLFRFIWYSMRRKANLGDGMLAYDVLDESLINFLERTATFTKQNTSYVIDQILDRLDKKLKENEATKFNKPEDNMDVFISYSRSDSHLAEQLYKALTAQGKRVWYDKHNITYGGLFMDEIRRAIRTAKYFVPILTHNIEKEKKDSHVYRNEWDTAIEWAKGMGRTYIIPVASDDFDFYKAVIPERMQQHNAIFYTEKEDLEVVAEKIVHKMNRD